MSKQAKTNCEVNEEVERGRRVVELFQAVATFGFLAAAMFCLGAPLVLAFAPGMANWFRHMGIVLSGFAGFLVVGCVLTFYCLFARKGLGSESPGAKLSLPDKSKPQPVGSPAPREEADA